MGVIFVASDPIRALPISETGNYPVFSDADPGYPISMTFGARLREERRRLGFKQGEFAELVGTDTPKQSLYENGHRSLRAAYLERVAAVGVDLIYVLTGRRSAGVLGEEADSFLALWMALPEEMRAPVQRLIGDLGEYVESQERPWTPSALKRKEGTEPDEG